MEMRFEKRLLQLIQENEIIYNSKHSEFKVYKSRMAVWDAIAKELHSDISTCRQRWRCLRNSYRKIKSKSTSTLNDSKSCMRKWNYINDFSFMDNESGCADSNKKFHAAAEQQTSEERTHKGAKALSPSARTKTKPQRQKISIEVEDTLVQEVRKYNLLWDKTHPDYRNNYQKSFVWKLIATKLQTTSKICRKIWLSMQSRYRRKIVKAKEQSGQIFYHTRWKHYGKMAFIDQFNNYSRSSESLDDEDSIIKTDFLSENKNEASLPVAAVEKLIKSKDVTGIKKLTMHRNLDKVKHCPKRQKLSAINTFHDSTEVLRESCSNYLHVLGIKVDELNIPSRVKYELERRVGNLVYEVLEQFSVDED